MVFGKHFTKYYLKYIYMFLAGIAVLIVVDIFQLEIPELISNILGILKINDEDRENVIASSVITPILTIFLYVGIIFLGRILWRFLIFGTARQIEYEIRNVMFLKSTNLSQDFYKKEKVGGLMAYFINDLEALRMAFGPGLLMLVDGLFLGYLSIKKMFELNKNLTYISTIPIVLVTVIMIIISKRLQNKFKERQKTFEDLSDYTQESFSGIEVIKAFVKEIKQLMFFQTKNKELKDKTLNFVKTVLWVEILIGIAINLVIMVILLYGSILVINNPANFSSEQLIEYVQYFFTLLWPAMALAQFLNIQAQANASKQRLTKFLDEKIDVKDTKDVLNITNLEPAILIKNLNFKYPDGENDVLKNINLDIKKGEMVGILGRTGSGKSSLVELLLRLYNVSDNELFIGGIDVNKIPIKTVRDLIGYVPQDNFLFSETIKSNIGFSYEYINEDILIESSKLSDVYDNIMEFKYKFDTILGERGVTVSGGQKQRISIARALAKNPEILILDDSVSAVDTETEEQIIDNMFKTRKGKTTIFIAHRISTVKKMDKIILLEKGKVVGVGTHDELMASSKLYQHMVNLQQLESLLERDGE